MVIGSTLRSRTGSEQGASDVVRSTLHIIGNLYWIQNSGARTYDHLLNYSSTKNTWAALHEYWSKGGSDNLWTFSCMDIKFEHDHQKWMSTKFPSLAFYRVFDGKMCREKLSPFDLNKKSNWDMKQYHCHKWTLGFGMSFISANLNATIRR